MNYLVFSSPHDVGRLYSLWCLPLFLLCHSIVFSFRSYHTLVMLCLRNSLLENRSDLDLTQVYGRTTLNLIQA